MRQTRVFWIFLVTISLGAMSCSRVSEPNLEREIEILKQGQEALRIELNEIRAQIQENQAQRPGSDSIRGVEFALGDNPVRGDSAAPLTLVEFTDYQ